MLYRPYPTTDDDFITDAFRKYMDTHSIRLLSILRKSGECNFDTLQVNDYVISHSGYAYRIVYVSKTHKTIRVQPLSNDGLPVLTEVKINRDASYYRLSAHQFSRLVNIDRYYSAIRDTKYILYDSFASTTDRRYATFD